MPFAFYQQVENFKAGVVSYLLKRIFRSASIFWLSYLFCGIQTHLLTINERCSNSPSFWSVTVNLEPFSDSGSAFLNSKRSVLRVSWRRPWLTVCLTSTASSWSTFHTSRRTNFCKKFAVICQWDRVPNFKVFWTANSGVVINATDHPITSIPFKAFFYCIVYSLRGSKDLWS